MKVIPPVAINDINLTAVSVVEPFVASAYSGGTTYAYGDLVSEGGFVYQSLQASNSNNDPALSPLYWILVGPVEAAWNSGTAYTGVEYVFYKHRVYLSIQAGTNKNPITNADYWQDAGPTNQYAMFDTERDTATVSPSPLTLSVTPGQRINTIGFLDIIADSVQVQVSVPGSGVVYDVTTQLLERTGIIDGYTYFFTPFTTQKNLVLFDLPSNTLAAVSVTFLRASGNISVGAVVIGTANELGAVQHDGAADEMENFSTIESDTFGNLVLIKRRAVSEPTMTVWAPAYLTDNIILLRDQLNAEPALWCGIESSDAYFFRALAVLGVYTQFDIGLPYESHSVLTLKLKEI